MTKAQDAVELLRSGLSLSEISKALQISFSSVTLYLSAQILQGTIRRSDLLFSYPPDERAIIEKAIEETGTTQPQTILEALRQKGGDSRIESLRLYLDLRDSRVSRGDMYELISEIEIALHGLIKNTLVAEYGPDENEWWRQGIPSKIRATCAAAREEDQEPADEPYCYTNFIHLQEILDKQWALFSKVLPKSIVNEKKKFLGGLAKLNHVRNCIMHPIKGLSVTEDDFAFVREFRASIDIDKWRTAVVPANS